MTSPNLPYTEEGTGRPPIEMTALDHPRFFMRWLSVQTVTIGEKPAG
jgi:hypothetical protein